jgi:acyl carrier protein
MTPDHLALEKILSAIYRAMKEISLEAPAFQKIGREPQSVLFGKGGSLDSLGLVNFLVTVEENIQDEFGISVTLGDERAMSRKHSPFARVESLAQYISILLKEKSSAS